MLTELCKELRNYFVRDIHTGKFNISGGIIDLPFLKNGQYFRIVKSDLNDGVYQYPCFNLIDEEFEGAIWAMAVPPNVVALASKIKEFEDKKGLPSKYSSESYGVYSYSVAQGENGQLTWQEAFSKELKPYRRLFEI